MKYSSCIFLLIVMNMIIHVHILAQPVSKKQMVHGTLVKEKLFSQVLRDNRIGLDTNRNIMIYLPPGYAESKKSYPVVYYLHSIFWSAEKLFEDSNLVDLLDRSFTSGMEKEFIFVAGDFTTPTTGCIYENSPVSGRWLDHITKELVPMIDQRYRTISHRNSRAVVGDFMGGRGALKLAMVNAELFSVVYALHPVATGTGQIAWPYVNIDWRKIYAAKTYEDLGTDHRTRLFVTISQAFIPNLNRPPFYCDYFMEPVNGAPSLHLENTIRTKTGFLLEETLAESAISLKQMRGIAFDWGRFDPTQDHVYANQAFSRKLEDLGVEHEAEEYRGNPWERNWTANGRFVARVLPFLSRHLVFENKK